MYRPLSTKGQFLFSYNKSITALPGYKWMCRRLDCLKLYYQIFFAIIYCFIITDRLHAFDTNFSGRGTVLLARPRIHFCSKKNISNILFGGDLFSQSTGTVYLAYSCGLCVDSESS